MTALPARAPFVRCTDIFPANGEIRPLHKGALGIPKPEAFLTRSTGF